MKNDDTWDFVAQPEGSAAADAASVEEVQRRAAVLDCDEQGRSFVPEVLSEEGYAVVRFERIGDLVQALWTRERFDVILASFRGTRDDALVGSRILRHTDGGLTPLLLLAHSEQLGGDASFTDDLAIHWVPLPCERHLLATAVTRVQAHASLAFGRYLFSPQARCVMVDGQRVRLKPREFDLALFLFRHSGATLSRQTLLDALWHRSSLASTTRTLDVHVANLRRKLGLNADSGMVLLPMRGIGYKLSASGL